MNIFLPLSKVDIEKREVWGTMAQELADKAGEIMDYKTSKPNFEKWSSEIEKSTDGKSLGNVREMHGHSAAGKLTMMEFDDKDKRIDVCAKVVDDAAWKKVIEGVYTGFSIGGSYARRWQDGDLKRYTAIPAEVSLVDNPCLPTATYQMIKADGSVEIRKVAAREDVKPAEGEGKYGDVEFADAKNKKYPLDTPAHTRFTASYFGMPKNRAKYSAEDQKTIDAKISAAKKKHGIGEGTAEKFAVAIGQAEAAGLVKEYSALTRVYGEWAKNGFKKGLCEVASLAWAIQSIDYICRAAEEEAEREGDSSKVPAMLAEIREKLGSVLVDMAQEEVEELTPKEEGEIDMNPTEKLQRALGLLAEVHGEAALGKAVSGKEHQSMVQEIHDHACALGAGHSGLHDKELKKDGYGLPETGDKAKADKPVERDKEDRDEEIHEAAKAVIADLQKRLSVLESQPAASKGASPVVVAVGKDGDDGAAREVAAKKAEFEKNASALDLVKAAAQNGRAMSPNDLMKL